MTVLWHLSTDQTHFRHPSHSSFAGHLRVRLGFCTRYAGSIHLDTGTTWKCSRLDLAGPWKPALNATLYLASSEKTVVFPVRLRSRPLPPCPGRPTRPEHSDALVRQATR